MSSNATYTHLRDGSWGVRLVGNARENQSVAVTKKDGTTKTETIARVLWTGRDSKSNQTISLCSIAQNGNGHSSSGGHSARRPGICVNCGDPCNPRYSRCLDCVDGGSNAHGGMSYYDRLGHFVLGDDD